VDSSISLVTAAISTTNATAELISHDLERRMPKPASATMKHINAANSAISANPFEVIIAFSQAALGCLVVTLALPVRGRDQRGVPLARTR